jgi:hypothetical protein
MRACRTVVSEKKSCSMAMVFEKYFEFYCYINSYSVSISYEGTVVDAPLVPTSFDKVKNLKGFRPKALPSQVMAVLLNFRVIPRYLLKNQITEFLSTIGH